MSDGGGDRRAIRTRSNRGGYDRRGHSPGVVGSPPTKVIGAIEPKPTLHVANDDGEISDTGVGSSNRKSARSGDGGLSAPLNEALLERAQEVRTGLGPPDVWFRATLEAT